MTQQNSAPESRRTRGGGIGDRISDLREVNAQPGAGSRSGMVQSVTLRSLRGRGGQTE